MEIHIDYKPTAKQMIFHTTTADVVLYGGAAGGGKSKAIVMDALSRCLRYPETHAYLLRRTYAELEDTLIKEAKASYPKELATYNVSRHEMTLTNGSQIHFRHCATISDMYNFQGAEIHWLYIDELTHFEKEIFEYLRTRLRAKRGLGIKPVVRCASNPGNIGHGWVKAMFVDAAPYMQLNTKMEYSATLKRSRAFTYQYIPALATDNPYITTDYIFELERKPKALREALLTGSWDSFDGQCFVEFVDDPAHYEDRINTHVIKPFDIPLSWPRYISFDHGYTKPFSVGWWACDPEGRLYRYKEWYGSDGTPNKGLELTPKEIAKGILEREQYEIKNNLYIDGVADPAIFDRSRGDSVADMMQDIGVTMRPAERNRIAGKMQVHERLRFDEKGKPGMYIFSTCKDFIRTLPAIPYDQFNPEDIDTDSEDHQYDDCRYMCMARPIAARESKFKSPAAYDPFGEVFR